LPQGSPSPRPKPATPFSPDETLLYVSNEEDSMLEVIEMESGISVRDVPTGGRARRRDRHT
jgi:hypothetical protein